MEPTGRTPAEAQPGAGPPRRPTTTIAGPAALVVGTLGVVFGDIGTSPLYAIHAVFATEGNALAPTEAAVYGVISLVFWTITLIVSVKYVTFIMRADNDGEGGIMALVALVLAAPPRRRRVTSALIALALFGAALFYGDGMITPAISVLSAVEGLQVAAPGLSSLVVPIALVVLAVLFGVQHYGTGAVARLFGPVMGLWFTAIAVAGLQEVVAQPQILRAVSPTYGLSFLAHHGATAFVALGAVVLTVTGAEALYADMGHFGASPIRRAWFLIVFPALTLSYMGQGALILHSPRAIQNPFYLLVPEWGQVPMVLLATLATVIASQAVISGAFSLTHQAVQLGFLPRLTIRHTSARHVGQIYVPAINWALFFAVAGLVVGFGSSAELAGAYGIAVTGTMTITTILFSFIARALWDTPRWVVVAGAAVFLTIDLTFFSAGLTKLPHGGWVPVSVGLAVFLVLTTWTRGREILERNIAEEGGPLRGFVDELRGMPEPVHRAPGTAVFLNTRSDTTPLALRANVEHNHVMHQSVVIVVLTETTKRPHVDPAQRLTIDDLGYRDDGITHLTARFGFRDPQDIPATLALAARAGLEGSIDVGRASYFLSRTTILRTSAPGMASWRKALFIRLWRNQTDPTVYFGLPEERAVIMGTPIKL